MNVLHIETMLCRLGQLLAASVLMACAVGVASTAEVSPEEPPLGVTQAQLSIAVGETPKCQEDEILCCPNGGPRCVCLPAGHTCTSGPVVSPGFSFAP